MELPQSATKDLLTWYDHHRRDLPWRVPFPQQPDPYHTLLSEIMLQQTTIATVQPYFHKFIKKWPTLKALASASLEEVMSAWSGLGYYRRAKALWQAAQQIDQQWQGQIPDNYDNLNKLPGIGPYTAAAIAAIAFHQPIIPMDGNIYRVVGRLMASHLDSDPKHAKKQVQNLAQDLVHPQRSGDVAQALMDIGATICTPQKPSCFLCPLRSHCEAFKMGTPDLFPPMPAKKERPEKKAIAFWLVNEKGEFYLRYRREAVLMDMLEVPSTPWDHAANQEALPPQWQLTPLSIRHVFTHFALTLHLSVPKYKIPYPPFASDEKGGWYSWDNLQNHPVPSLTKKLIKAGLTLPSSKKPFNVS